MNDFEQHLVESTRYRANLGNSVWLMHDHRWAFYCWELVCQKQPHALAHVDHHWDAVNDFKDSEKIKALKRASLSDIEAWTNVWRGKIRFDNFIAPAIIRGLVRDVHFLCEQEDGGLWPSFLQDYRASQILHPSVESLLEAMNSARLPRIFDLDLDLFNRHSKYYGQELNLISELASLIRSAEVVTIATSRMNMWRNGDEVTDWAWDTEIADAVTRRVVPEIQRLRSG